MRLIDADAFIEYLGLDNENAREDNIGEIVTLEDFDRQPTVYEPLYIYEVNKKDIENIEPASKEFLEDCKITAEKYRRLKNEN